eukprot:TRINITY_DN4349_c0_g1_i3.p2 TRINITY_DN4349_c0_g1~~TRINITY_DN4349_c0_g1_i3.p2  ORF type:complete len:171 (-),score=27.47 TRINITY_DN4349_c0_g1_i3:166-678(-)
MSNSFTRNRTIDDKFVRAVEAEYAVKYLEYLGIEPTKKNAAILLATAPFKECRITPGWENTEEAPSSFVVYPPIRKRTVQAVQSSKKPSLPPIQEKPVAKMAIDNDKGEQEGLGIPKLTVDVIRKRYLYPFSIDSKNPITSNSGEVEGAGTQLRFSEHEGNATAFGCAAV